MLAAVLCLLVPKSQTLDTIHIGTYPSQDLTDTLLDNTLVRKDGETPLFDGQGSERTVTNSSQTVTGTLTQDGCGNTVATTGSSANPYMYAATSGYRNDGDAGLMHVGARYYDAQVGRFTSRDTFLNQKPYLYCDHDPVNAVDPSGHDKYKEGDWWSLMNDINVGTGALIGGYVGGGSTFGWGTIKGGIIGTILGHFLTDIEKETYHHIITPPTPRERGDINLSPIFHFPGPAC